MHKFRNAALIGLLCVAVLAGCDYVPQQVFEVQTTDGKTLKLLCPMVDPHRSRLTYVVDGECVAIIETD